MQWITALVLGLILSIVLGLAVACGSDSSAPVPSSGVQSVSTAGSISTTQAINHVGQRATVCGNVVDSRYATSSRGQPTFLNFDKPYPSHVFTVVIWGSDRSKFPASPESYYRGKKVCATGLIETYQRKAQIIARNGDQLQVVR